MELRDQEFGWLVRSVPHGAVDVPLHHDLLVVEDSGLQLFEFAVLGSIHVKFLFEVRAESHWARLNQASVLPVNGKSHTVVCLVLVVINLPKHYILSWG